MLSSCGKKLSHIQELFAKEVLKLSSSLKDNWLLGFKGNIKEHTHYGGEAEIEIGFSFLTLLPKVKFSVGFIKGLEASKEMVEKKWFSKHSEHEVESLVKNDVDADLLKNAIDNQNILKVGEDVMDFDFRLGESVLTHWHIKIDVGVEIKIINLSMYIYIKGIILAPPLISDIDTAIEWIMKIFRGFTDSLTKDPSIVLKNINRDSLIYSL